RPTVDEKGMRICVYGRSAQGAGASGARISTGPSSPWKARSCAEDMRSLQMACLGRSRRRRDRSRTPIGQTTKRRLYRLLYMTLIDMRAEDHDAENRLVFLLAELFHNIPLQLD